MDYNGNSFEMGRLLGTLQARMDHLGEASERQNDILLDIKDTLSELPDRIASKMTATPVSVTPKTSTLGLLVRMATAAKEFMPPLKEIIFALILIAVSLGWIAPQHVSSPGRMLPTQSPD